MKAIKKGNQFEITFTVAELREMRALDQRVWGTPNMSEDTVMQVYVATRPSWRTDVAVGDTLDFLAAAGWDSLAESAEEDEAETVTVSFPRDCAKLRAQRAEMI